LDGEKLPRFISFTNPVGKVSHAARLEFGIPEGIPVFSGGPDFLMSLLGTGAILPGATHDRAGSSEGINHCLGQAAEHVHLRTVPGVLQNTYNISGILPFSGRIMERAAAEYFPAASSLDAVLEQALSQAPLGDTALFIPPAGLIDRLFVPLGSQSAAGPRTAEQKNWLAQENFIGLKSEHSPAIKLRTVLEAVSMQLKLILENIKGLGFAISEMSISGGQAQSQAFIQLKADILGISIKLPSIIDAELMGGACLAFLGLGEYDSVQEAASDLVCFKKTIEPQAQYAGLYEEKFKRFKAMVFLK
jgi:xylulokinase